MAQIANASDAYVSAGNGNAYSLMPKIYIASGYDVNTSNSDAYIQYDSQGNFTIKGCSILNSSAYQFGYINYPTTIFGPAQQHSYDTFYPQFIQQPKLTKLIDQNGNDITQYYQLYPYSQILINAQNGQLIPSGTYYFTIKGQAPLVQHLI